MATKLFFNWLFGYCVEELPDKSDLEALLVLPSIGASYCKDFIHIIDTKKCLTVGDEIFLNKIIKRIATASENIFQSIQIKFTLTNSTKY